MACFCSPIQSKPSNHLQENMNSTEVLNPRHLYKRTHARILEAHLCLLITCNGKYMEDLGKDENKQKEARCHTSSHILGNVQPIVSPFRTLRRLCH